jgi:ABC-type dipeptide/oligopeptide/nickel transport system permease component
VFSLRLRWFPALDLGGPRSFVLPVTTLVVMLSPVLTRTARQSFIETLNEDYVKAARSRGLPEWRVFSVHGVKAASLPLVTLIGLQLGFLLAGAVVVEAIFNWPGIGKLILDALASRDFPMIQGGILVAAVVFVVLNFVVDLLYTVLDPRVRAGVGS